MREFIHRLPWLCRKYPSLARFFKTIDKDSSAMMTLEEFIELLTPKRAKQEMRRDDNQVAYDVIFDDKIISCGSNHKFRRTKSFERRDPLEPTLKCEVAGPCGDIHHQGHLFDWKIPKIQTLRETTPMQLYITSRTFKLAGSSGVLRFWPKGYPAKYKTHRIGRRHPLPVGRASERFSRQA